MFTPADREEEARRQLVERVYAETGVRLGPEWRVRLSVHSNGKEGNLADREYKRFFSPGGKRFESAGAITYRATAAAAKVMKDWVGATTAPLLA